MKTIAFWWRIVRLTIQLLRGLLISVTSFARGEQHHRHAIIRSWSREVLHRAGVEVRTATHRLVTSAGGDVIPPQDQITLLPTTQLLIANRSSPKRKVVYTVKQDNGPLAAGNPINGGGVFGVVLDGYTQCFPLPAQHWVYTSSGRYRYKDPGGLSGQVSAAQLERTTRGQFRLKIVALGKLGPINLIPPAAQADINVSLGNFGVKYCGSTAGGAVVRNDNEQFKVKSAPAPGACAPVTCP